MASNELIGQKRTIEGQAFFVLFNLWCRDVKPQYVILDDNHVILQRQPKLVEHWLDCSLKSSFKFCASR